MKIIVKIPEGKLSEEPNQGVYSQTLSIYLPKKALLDIANALEEASQAQEEQLFINLCNGAWELR